MTDLAPAPYVVQACKGEDTLPIGCLTREEADAVAEFVVTSDAGYDVAILLELRGTVYWPVATHYAV